MSRDAEGKENIILPLMFTQSMLWASEINYLAFICISVILLKMLLVEIWLQCLVF